MSDLTLQQKLLRIQQELKAPKTNFNSFGDFNYRSLEDILEAVKPINDKYGITLTLTDRPVQIGERYYIEATALITDNDQEFRVTAYAREPQSKTEMDDAQVTGTSSSYARKYALNGLYLIDDTKDADTDEYQKQNGKQQEKQVGRAILLAKYKQGGKSEKEFNEWYAAQAAQGKTNNEMDMILTQALKNKSDGK